LSLLSFFELFGKKLGKNPMYSILLGPFLKRASSAKTRCTRFFWAPFLKGQARQKLKKWYMIKDAKTMDQNKGLQEMED
jgi:hypothetical protein